VIVCLKIVVVDDCTLCSECNGICLTVVEYFFYNLYGLILYVLTGQADTTFTIQMFWPWCMVIVVTETLDIACHPRLNTPNIL